MANINIDYESMKLASQELLGAQEIISPQITSLYTEVDALLTQDGGLWMKQTSPAFQESYQKLNTSAIAVVNAIQSFSDMFASLITNLSQMDGAYAFQLNNPTSG
jgi:uncharacterized protein YukE